MRDQPSSVSDRRRPPHRSSARSRALAIGLCLVLLASASGLVVVSPAPPAQASHDTEPASGDPILFAAGDIARPPGGDPNVGNVRVADLIEAQSPQPDLILTLGDNQYDSGSLVDFMGQNAFDETWGRFKSRMRPTFGDEDYGPGGPTDTGYYDYFNGDNATGPAGPENLGYYSFDIGSWHVVVLNTEIDTGATSAQADWLRNDLATHARSCTLATAHRPIFSSNQSGSGNMEALAEILYDNGADLLLSGHVHSYERFRKQDVDGGADADGFRQFVVGTGGHSTGSLAATPEPGSEARGDKYGVLKLTLKPTSYDWVFIPLPGDTEAEAGGTVLDESGGTDACVRPLGTTPAPTVSHVVGGSLAPGTNALLTVQGTNFTSETTVSFGAGVTVVDVNPVLPNSLIVAVSVASDAVPGPRNVIVTNPGAAPAVCTGCFVVTGAGPPPPTGPRNGYWLTATDGGIFAYGTATFYGSTGAITLAQPIVGMAATPSGNGYWFVARDGGVFNYGDAAFFGSTGNIRLAQPIVGMAATPTGKGYWLVAADGGIFSFGDATFHGSAGNIRLARPIVAMAATPTGNGYVLTASDGGIFTYGDATFHGSTGSLPLAKPIVAMATTPTGRGYWLTATDGGVFAFGDAQFHGSTGNLRLAQPIVGMAATATGRGYWFVGADGGVFTFGDATFEGGVPPARLARPVVGMAAVPQ